MSVDAIIQSSEALEEAIYQLNSLNIRKTEYFNSKNEKKYYETEKEVEELKKYILALIIQLDKLANQEKNERLN